MRVYAQELDSPDLVAQGQKRRKIARRNCRKPKARPSACDAQHRSFAGNLAFFAVAPHHGEEGQTGRLDMEISGVLQRLARQGLETAGELRVTFVARGAGEGAPERLVRIGRLRVVRR